MPIPAWKCFYLNTDLCTYSKSNPTLLQCHEHKLNVWKCHQHPFKNIYKKPTHNRKNISWNMLNPWVSPQTCEVFEVIMPPGDGHRIMRCFGELSIGMVTKVSQVPSVCTTWLQRLDWLDWHRLEVQFELDPPRNRALAQGVGFQSYSFMKHAF